MKTETRLLETSQLSGHAFPKASVIVCVYNRPKQVIGCLESLVTQDYPDFEIVVVDDGSTDATPEAVEEYVRSSSRVPVRVVRNLRNLGVSGARNSGIVAAEGEMAFFIDSDCTAEPGWLRAMVHAMLAADAVAVAGAVVDRRPRCYAEWAAAGTTRLVDAPLQRRPLVGGNMGFRRSVVLEIGFDPALFYGADEDDVARRLAADGKKIAFAAKAVVCHDHPMTVRTYLRQAWMQGQGSAHYWQKHGMLVGRDIVFLILALFSTPLVLLGVTWAVIPAVLFAVHAAAHLYNEIVFKGKTPLVALWVLPLVLLHSLVKTASVGWWWLKRSVGRNGPAEAVPTKVKL